MKEKNKIQENTPEASVRHPLRKILLSVLAASAVAAAGAGSFGGMKAYLSDGDTKDNKFIIGDVNTPIVETFDPNGKFDTQAKDVKIENTGANDVYVRVKAVWSDEELGKYFKMDWNTSDWTDGEDGFWYYDRILKKGETTPSLFTKAALKDDEDTDEVKGYIERAEDGDRKTGAGEGFDFYLLGPVDLIIYNESAQAYDVSAGRDFNTAKDAFEVMERNK